MVDRIGVSLLPLDTDRDRLIDLQRQLGHDALEPRLDSDHNRPHVALYQGVFYDNVPMESVLRDIVRATQLTNNFPGQFEVTTTVHGVQDYPEGWVLLELVKTEQLQKLQFDTLNALRDYINFYAIDHLTEYPSATLEERASYHQWGYRYAGSTFHPHVTLGKTTEAAAHAVTQRWNTPHQAAEEFLRHPTVRFDRLAFYAAGEYGAHETTLAEISLRNIDLTQTGEVIGRR